MITAGAWALNISKPVIVILDPSKGFKRCVNGNSAKVRPVLFHCADSKRRNALSSIFGKAI